MELWQGKVEYTKKIAWFYYLIAVTIFLIDVMQMSENWWKKLFAITILLSVFIYEKKKAAIWNGYLMVKLTGEVLKNGELIGRLVSKPAMITTGLLSKNKLIKLNIKQSSNHHSTIIILTHAEMSHREWRQFVLFVRYFFDETSFDK